MIRSDSLLVRRLFETRGEETARHWQRLPYVIVPGDGFLGYAASIQSPSQDRHPDYDLARTPWTDAAFDAGRIIEAVMRMQARHPPVHENPDVARISAQLLAALETAAPPKDRQEEAAKARVRGAQRISCDDSVQAAGSGKSRPRRQGVDGDIPRIVGFAPRRHQELNIGCADIGILKKARNDFQPQFGDAGHHVECPRI